MILRIILKDDEGKEISIFSNDIENYFNGGAVYRFLRCLTNIYLNERGLVLSKTETDNIAMELFTNIITNQLSDQNRIVSDLPAMISHIMGSTQQVKYQNKSSAQIPTF